MNNSTWNGNMAATSNAPSLGDIRDAMALMEKLKAKHDVEKSATYFAILGMAKCTTCGHKIEYREGPPETVVLCDHQLNALKAKCEVRTGLPSFSGIGGFSVEVLQRKATTKEGA